MSTDYWQQFGQRTCSHVPRLPEDQRLALALTLIKQDEERRAQEARAAAEANAAAERARQERLARYEAARAAAEAAHLGRALTEDVTDFCGRCLSDGCAGNCEVDL